MSRHVISRHHYTLNFQSVMRLVHDLALLINEIGSESANVYGRETGTGTETGAYHYFCLGSGNDWEIETESAVARIQKTGQAQGLVLEEREQKTLRLVCVALAWSL